MRTIARLAAICGFALSAPLVALPANAAPAQTQQTFPYKDCSDYASKTSEASDWTCLGGWLTTAKTVNGKSVTTTSQIAPDTATPTFHTDVVSPDRYTSTVANKDLYASLGGVRYDVPVVMRVRLFNHSPEIKFSYTSDKPVSMYATVGVRRDNSGAPDDTIHIYSDAIGTYQDVTNFSETFGANGSGESYRVLPFDGKRYFIDFTQFRVSSPNGHAVSLFGNVQSDRMTCYKTTDCKF